MATTKNVKPVTKTIVSPNVGELIVKVFGDSNNPTPNDQIAVKLDDLSLDEQIALYAYLGTYAQAIQERMKAVMGGLLANPALSVQNAYGDANPNIEVTTQSGGVIGNVVFDTVEEDTLNTVTNPKAADDVKKALTAANLDSNYIKSQPRLDNATLKADFLANKLPNSVSTLLKVKHESKREVRFAPRLAQKEAKK